MSRKSQLLQEQFDGFMKAIGLGPVAGVQRQEMRRAFFAGARSYSSLVMVLAEPGDEPTDNDMALMAALEAEMEAFLADVEAGRA